MNSIASWDEMPLFDNEEAEAAFGRTTGWTCA